MAKKLSLEERAAKEAEKVAAKAAKTAQKEEAKRVKRIRRKAGPFYQRGKARKLPAGSFELPAPIREAPVPVKIRGAGCDAPEGGFCFDLGKANGKPLAPIPAKAPPVSPVTQFFANNLTDVCRVKKVPAYCVVPGTENTDDEQEIKAWGKDTKFPEPKDEDDKRKACKAAKGFFMPSFEEKLRLGKTELDLLSKAQAKAIGRNAPNVPVRAGPNLRLCFADKQQGVMVPLKSPQEAVVVRDAYRECLAKNGEGAAKECAIDVARFSTKGIGPKQMPALFGAPKRRRSRR